MSASRTWLLAALLGLAALAACILLVGQPLAGALRAARVPNVYDTDRMVLFEATLPRLAMAALCGAALAVAGAVLQQVLRNPLASPTTLGVDAGARLALALAGVFFPALISVGRDLVALAGSAAALALVFAVSRGKAFSAINIVLAGMVVSLYCGSLSVILTLAKDRYLVGLFVWGSGSLSLQSWQPVADLAIRLVPTLIPLAALIRPMALLELGDETSRGRGVPVQRIRAVAIVVAVLISAFVTSAVGVIGFIGLAAPLLARLAGARRFAARLGWSAVLGAFLLLLTDAALQLVAGQASAFLPTGAVTAALGSPLLLILLPRLKLVAPPPIPEPVAGDRVPPRTRLYVAVLAACMLVGLLALLVGRTAEGGWSLLSSWQDWAALMPWRAPRFFAGCASGAMLAAAGLILQRLTGNPMASPEILGVSAGSILAVVVTLLLFGHVGGEMRYASATVGGLVVLVMVLLLSRRAGFAPERVLLAGIALSAGIDAIVGVLSATGDPNAVMLLNWLSGSMSGTSEREAAYAAGMAVVLIGLASLTFRWLAILPLGAPQAAALGLPVARARLALFGLAALLTAAATPIAGPLTFVGLMAPHIVATLRVHQALPALVVSAVLGATLIGAADFLARTVAFPIMLPTGITAALVAGPFLIVLLRRRMGAL